VRSPARSAPTRSAATTTSPPIPAITTRARARKFLSEDRLFDDYGRLPSAGRDRVVSYWLSTHKHAAEVTVAAVRRRLAHASTQIEPYDSTAVRPGDYIGVAARLVAARNADNRKGSVLRNRQAIGKTVQQLRDLIGPPDHKQLVAGTRYWYYDSGGKSHQLVIAGGVVVQHNEY
jgi:hypothetical protein